ncbi:DUF4129 domain-containing protein [Arthrobacter zhaoguopingii]|uniref:DUF4129 domain-containing protein n=1 Tax=Arthrobacter zhaoguopingii TaxID=2681491 RepID=UPI00135B1B5B|nr:DUF4129 domain-containing protein [Arthrobacter zhaoguopingii]
MGETPVGPDEARELLQDELAKPAYQEAQPSLLERAVQAALDWILEALSGIRSVGAGPGTLLLAAGAVLIIVVAVLLIRPRLNARADRTQRAVFSTGAALPAAEHRRRAAAAAGAGRWSEALAERLRAVVRDAEERGLLEERLSRTATEAAAGLAPAFPGSAGEIRWLAERFNEVQYGRGAASEADEADAARAEALDAALAAGVPAGGGVPAGEGVPGAAR